MTVVYIPGLGNYDFIRKCTLFLWRLQGVKVVFFKSHWMSDETSKARISRLKTLVKSSKSSVIIGESAGACLALHYLADVNDGSLSVVTLCGVCQKDTPINDKYRRRYPVFYDMTRSIPHNINPNQIVCFRARLDESVPEPYSSVNESSTFKLFSYGHLTTILASLTVFSPRIINEIKRKNNFSQ